MTTHELLEMAALDAMGLLEDDEREAFERAFQSASPAVQAQIRREQARMARADGILPEIEPPPGLRARVIAAVREAMQAALSRGGVAGRVGPLLPSRGVSPIWRAAAVACVAASVVFGMTTVYMRGEFEKINNQLSTDVETRAWIRDWGARFEQRLFDPSTKLVAFTPTASAEGGRAVLMLDSGGGGQLLFKDLPASDNSYSLCIVDVEGHLIGSAVLTFKSNGGKSSQPIRGVDLTKLPEGQSLAIIGPAESARGKDSMLLRGVKS